jgi:hypothetical protein
MKFDTSELISQIKRISSTPTSQSLFLDADFLLLANQELSLGIVSMINSVVEDYFVVTQDFTVDSTTPYISIPSVATGLAVRELYVIDSIGGEIIGNARRIAPENIGQNAGSTSFGWDQAQSRAGFYLESDKIRFYPTPTATTYFRLSYYRAPNELVTINSGGKVVGIDYPTNKITLDFVPTSWVAGTVVDIIKKDLPFGLRASSITIASKSGFDITFASGDLPAGIVNNDYVYLAGQSPVPQYIPREGFYLLAQSTAVKVLESMDDQSGLKGAYVSLENMKKSFIKIISPRIVGEMKKVTSTNSVMRKVSSKFRRF